MQHTGNWTQKPNATLTLVFRCALDASIGCLCNTKVLGQAKSAQTSIKKFLRLAAAFEIQRKQQDPPRPIDENHDWSVCDALLSNFPFVSTAALGLTAR